MDRSNRPLWILATATLAILVMFAGWWLYRSQPAPEPEPPPAPMPAPVALGPPAPAPQAPATQAPLPDLAGRILADGCRQGECRWSRVVSLQRVSNIPQGELRRLTARSGSSNYDPMGDAPEAYSDSLRVRWDPADRSEYIFCSRERPAFAFPDDGGGYIIHYLDLYSLAGYQLSSARTFMRVCHDAQFDGEDTPLLRQLGYRPGTRSEQIEGGTPEDLTRF